MEKLQGIIPPIPTPFNLDGSVDFTSLESLLEYLSPHVDGFLVLGSNGEAAYLTESERTEVLKHARKVISKDKLMIAGTGGESTALVAERNAIAHDVGADCVLILPPHYYKGAMSDSVLTKHYEQLANNSALPVLLYNVPAATTIALSPSLIAHLAQHSNIQGLKDSSGNIASLTETMRLIPEGFSVVTGNAPTLLAALALGAKGGILAVANIAAKAYGQIIKSFKAGAITEAKALQLRYNPIAVAVTTKYGVPGLKATMRLQNVTAGMPRSPLQDVSDDVKEELKSILADLDL